MTCKSRFIYLWSQRTDYCNVFCLIENQFSFSLSRPLPAPRSHCQSNCICVWVTCVCNCSEMARISPMSLVQSGRTGPVTVGIALATVGNRCLHALVRRWDRWRTELAILFFCLWDGFTSLGRRPLTLNMFSGREQWLHFNLPSVSLLLIESVHHVENEPQRRQ